MTVKGGNKLKLALDQILKKVNKATAVRVGFMADATYPDGTQVAMVAAIQDFGAPKAGIPPRPFFRNAIENHKDEWPQVLEKALKVTDYDSTKALSLVGEHIVGDVKNSIINGAYAPLSPVTVARKGHSKPLVDTGQMLNSVTYKVE